MILIINLLHDHWHWSEVSYTITDIDDVSFTIVDTGFKFLHNHWHWSEICYTTTDTDDKSDTTTDTDGKSYTTTDTDRESLIRLVILIGSVLYDGRYRYAFTDIGCVSYTIGTDRKPSMRSLILT